VATGPPRSTDGGVSRATVRRSWAGQHAQPRLLDRRPVEHVDESVQRSGGKRNSRRSARISSAREIEAQDKVVTVVDVAARPSDQLSLLL
jgi:hypothetical protein